MFVVDGWDLFRSTIQPPTRRRWQERDQPPFCWRNNQHPSTMKRKWKRIGHGYARSAGSAQGTSASSNFSCFSLLSLDESRFGLEGEMVVDTKVLKFVPGRKRTKLHPPSSSDLRNEKVERVVWKGARYETNSWHEIPIHSLNQHHEFTLWPIPFLSWFGMFRMVPDGSGWFRMVLSTCRGQCATPKIWALSDMASGSHWRYRIHTWEIVRKWGEKTEGAHLKIHKRSYNHRETKNFQELHDPKFGYSELLWAPWAPDAAGRVSWKGTKWIFENSGLAPHQSHLPAFNFLAFRCISNTNNTYGGFLKWRYPVPPNHPI